MRRQPIEIFLEEFILGFRCRPIDITTGRTLLVRTEQQAAIFLAHVPGGIGFAQHAHFGQALPLTFLDQGMRLGHDILVLDRDDGNVDTEHLAGLAHEIAGRRDNVFAGDVALVGLDQPFARRLLLDADDRGIAIDLGTAIARTLGQCLREIGGLDIAVIGMLDGTDDAVSLAKRPDFLELLQG